MTHSSGRTQHFYDDYWPRNIPDREKTRSHVRAIVPVQRYERALDGGCGTGVCSLALCELSDLVVGVDISGGSLRTARELSRATYATNLTLCQASLLELPFPANTFDLVFSWGVIHHTANPVRALDELVRVLRPAGTLVLAVYLRTPLTVVHELIRHGCLRLPSRMRSPVIKGVAGVVRLAEMLGHANNVRDDNPLIESQVEDWYFVPEKHFFTVEEMGELFRERGLTFEVVCRQTGRFRSSSNFIVRGVRRPIHPSANCDG